MGGGHQWPLGHWGPTCVGCLFLWKRHPTPTTEQSKSKQPFNDEPEADEGGFRWGVGCLRWDRRPFDWGEERTSVDKAVRPSEESHRPNQILCRRQKKNLIGAMAWWTFNKNKGSATAAAFSVRKITLREIITLLAVLFLFPKEITLWEIIIKHSVREFGAGYSLRPSDSTWPSEVK